MVHPVWREVLCDVDIGSVLSNVQHPVRVRTMQSHLRPARILEWTPWFRTDSVRSEGHPMIDGVFQRVKFLREHLLFIFEFLPVPV